MSQAKLKTSSQCFGEIHKDGSKVSETGSIKTKIKNHWQLR